LKLGIALPVFDLETLTPLSVAEVAEDAIRAEAAGFESLWVMDHIFLEQRGARVSGHEPMTLLGYLSAITTSACLGALVLCNAFRHAGQLAREAAALADASSGRFVLALGCGSQPVEHAAFAFPYSDRVSRLEETLVVLRPALSGERVDFDGRYIQIRNASIVTTVPTPPLWLAASGPRMMRLAARFCDGWIGDFYGPDTARFRAELGSFQEALADVGRSPELVEIVVGLNVLVADDQDRASVLDRASRLSPPSEVPLEDRALIGDAERIADKIQEYWAAGADHVVLVPSPWHFGRFRIDAIKNAATVVKLAHSM